MAAIARIDYRNYSIREIFLYWQAVQMEEWTRLAHSVLPLAQHRIPYAKLNPYVDTRKRVEAPKQNILSRLFAR